MTVYKKNPMKILFKRVKSFIKISFANTMMHIHGHRVNKDSKQFWLPKVLHGRQWLLRNYTPSNMGVEISLEKLKHLDNMQVR